jgi:hypothetical protein
MFWFKSCPRCRGDLYEGKDIYGRYVACLQCGHYLGEAEELVLSYPLRRKVEVHFAPEAGAGVVTSQAVKDARILEVAV